MRWLEIIHLRPTETRSQALDHLASLRPQLEAIPHLIEARVYAQAGMGTDVAAHLAWLGDAMPARTGLGLAIAEGLRRFGLVDHSVWQEEAP